MTVRFWKSGALAQEFRQLKIENPGLASYWMFISIWFCKPGKCRNQRLKTKLFRAFPTLDPFPHPS